MTNHQSVATVTAMLSQAIQGFATRAIQGARVTMSRPDNVVTSGTEQTSDRVNLFLFQIGFDPSSRNDDLPTRDRAGKLLQRPRAALQLHYLLSFYGDEAVLAPQRMFAAVVAGLHARPLISMDHAAAFVADNQGIAEPFHYLADSKLAEQAKPIHLIPDSLNLEELSKLWSVFFQVPYALSIAYKASVVLVDAEEELPRSALPVRAPVVEARASAMPESPAVTPPVRPRVLGVELVDVTVDGRSVSMIRVTSAVTIGASQRVEVLLNERGGAHRSAVLSAPRRDSDQNHIQVPRGDLRGGAFLVRLRVDGLDSRLSASGAPADWSYSDPQVVLP